MDWNAGMPGLSSGSYESDETEHLRHVPSQEDLLGPVVHGLKSDCDLLWTRELRCELQKDAAARREVIEACEQLAGRVRRMDEAVKEVERQVAQGQLQFEESC